MANLNDRELATVLHALRLMQELESDERCCLDLACDHFKDFEALDSAELDSLCERLNLRRPSVLRTPSQCDDCGKVWKRYELDLFDGIAFTAEDGDVVARKPDGLCPQCGGPCFGLEPAGNEATS